VAKAAANLGAGDATLRHKTRRSNGRSRVEQQVMQQNQRHGTQPNTGFKPFGWALVPKFPGKKIPAGGNLSWLSFPSDERRWKSKTPRQAGAFAGILSREGS
jgi:hypothetical protein